jgi:putative transposase
MIRKSHSIVSIQKQCELFSVARSSYYTHPKGESDLNLELMDLMDEYYQKHPEKGARRMHIWLTKDKCKEVSRNRIERLYYKVMGLRAIMPGPHTSKRCKDHAVYPYLLRDLKIEGPNQVWAMDITYIGISKGFMYLCAVIDLYSRYVVGWSLSNTMDASWCQQTLQESIEVHGCPRIINTDQGSQFTSEVFTQFIKDQKGLCLSMDGKGRATDNAFIERLWRSVKYEKIHLYKPQGALELYLLLQEYFHYYNYERRHSAIDYSRPYEKYSLTTKVGGDTSSLPHSNTHDEEIPKRESPSIEIWKTGRDCLT